MEMVDSFSLNERDPRALQAFLPENEKVAKRVLAEVEARRKNPEAFIEKVMAFYEAVDKASAAGEPGLLNQQIPNYITEEALATSFAMQFGQVVEEGGPDQVPEFTLADPDAVSIFEVSLTNQPQTGSRRRRKYTVSEVQTTGRWQEIQTEPVYIEFVNPFFPRKRALIETQANLKAAYAMERELDRISWALIDNAIQTTFTKAFTFRDSDVLGIPAGNSGTSSASFWKTLRTNVIPYFQGVGKANRVINIHLLHTDLQYLYQVAPLGATLGGYSQFQEAVYAGNITDIVIYGHRFRIIPQNSRITTGKMYCTVGPVFKMWLPPTGSHVRRVVEPGGDESMSIHRIYANLQPSVWFTNLYYSTWSTTDTAG